MMEKYRQEKDCQILIDRDFTTREQIVALMKRQSYLRSTIQNISASL